MGEIPPLRTIQINETDVVDEFRVILPSNRRDLRSRTRDRQYLIAAFIIDRILAITANFRQKLLLCLVMLLLKHSLLNGYFR